MTPTEAPRRTTVVIAIDGPAASGKGTLARRLAAHFGYAYFESGLLYRATALRLLREGLDPADSDAAADAAAEVTAADLAAPELRHDEIANAAGIVAANPAVRNALIDAQRRFIVAPPEGAAGVVMDGRDIGTVICPDANHKIFVDASLEVRAERRLKELRRRGVEGIESRVLQDMSARDARDRDRRVAPLVPAEDAFLLDTTGLDADVAFAAALDHIESQNTS